MGKRGPAPDPRTEPKVIKSFSFTASQWEDVKEHIPAGERSRLVQAGLQLAREGLEQFASWQEWRDSLYRRGGTLERYARAWAERWDNFHVESDFVSLPPEDRQELTRFQEATYALWWNPATSELMEQSRVAAAVD